MKRLQNITDHFSVVIVVVAACGIAIGCIALTQETSLVPPAEASIATDAQRAAMVGQVATGQGQTTVDDFQVTGIDATTAQTLAIPAGTRIVDVQAEDQSLRWTSDGTAPTATVGNIIGGAVMVGAVYWFVYLRKPSSSGKS